MEPHSETGLRQTPGCEGSRLTHNCAGELPLHSPRRVICRRGSLRAMRFGRYDVSVTNLDKVFFPANGLTKGDLIRHYVDLAEYLLPHVGHRPMQMLRYPHGVDGDFFYQKRVPNPHPD